MSKAWGGSHRNKERQMSNVIHIKLGRGLHRFVNPTSGRDVIVHGERGCWIANANFNQADRRAEVGRFGSLDCVKRFISAATGC